MKFTIYILFLLLLGVDIYSQTYNVQLYNDKVELSLFNSKDGKYSLNNKLNPIDSFYYFRVAVDSRKPIIKCNPENIKIEYSNGIIRKNNYIEIRVAQADLINKFKSVDITIFYNRSLSVKKTPNLTDSNFFEDFINIEHVHELKMKSLGEQFQSTDWYKSNLDYVKFYTTEDSPALVEARKIIELVPDWRNKNLNNFTLYQRGVETPFYIIDKDGFFNENDTIIFMGSRAFGDTTYYENYTNKEAFFLTYDVSKSGKRLTLKNSDYQNGNLLDYVYIDNHYETDNKYSTGSLFISNYFTNQIEKSNHFDTRTVMGEGWYWDVLSPKNNGLPNDTTKGDFFVNYQNINPIFDNEETLKIKMYYSSLQDSLNSIDFLPQRITHYNVIFDVNGKNYIESKFSGYKRDFLELEISNKDLYPGHNDLKVIQKELYSTTNSSILVDYFTITGQVRAIANNGRLNFRTNEAYNQNILVSNLKSNRLILINKDENSISLSNSQNNGFYIRASADSKNSNFVSMSINDSIISANGNGLHFFIAKAPDYKEFKYLNGNSNNSEIIEYISNLENNSVIIISNAGKNNNNGLSSLIGQLGADTNPNNLEGNWIFATLKGTNQSEEIFHPNDIVRISKMIENNNGNSYSFKLNISSDIGSNISISDIKSAETPIPSLVKKVNLLELENNVSAIYITHKNFIEAAKRLKNYREESQEIKVKLIDVEDIYNQFNYGNESPHAIKNYLKYYYNSSYDLPKYLTLFGDASWDPRKVSANSISNNYLPAYGNPVSDFWYGLLDGENDFDPEIFVGRISIKSNEEANNVVDKLIHYDTTSAAEWMKRYLFLTGGLDAGERNRFFSYLSNYYSQYINSNTYCNKIDYVRKSENSPSSSSQGTEIRDKINNGNIWTIYIGHAASEIFELDGWSAFSLNNNQKYGLLSTISCNTGAFAEPNLITSRNEEYLLVPNKGFIGVMGSTTLGFVGEHNYITSKMIELIADSSNKERNLGEIFYYGKTKMAKNSYQLFTLYHFSLLGDPLTRFRFGKKTDPYLNNDNISISIDGEAKQATDKDNKATIKGKVLNYGYNTNQYFELRLKRTYNGTIDSSSMYFNDLCKNNEFTFDIDIKEKSGVHNISLILDPENILNEENINNNVLNLKIEVFKDGLIFLDPQANWDLSKNDPIIRVLNPLDSTKLFDYYFAITKNNDEAIYISNSINNSNEFDINEDYIDWKPSLSNLEEGFYLIKSRSVNKLDGKLSEWNIIPVHLVEESEKDRISYKLNTDNDINFIEKSNLKYNNHEEILELNSYSLPFKTLSVRGVFDSNFVYTIRPYVNIEVGNKVFVQGYHDRGFNIGVFSATPNGISTKYRLFDTWGKDESHPEGNWYKDSVAIDLVRFLRDSVGENDYLFIGTSSSVFRLPVYFKIFAEEANEGSVDTLLSILKSYGSYIADTLVLDTNNQGFDISFTMAGYKGAKMGTVYEAINMNGDSARTQGEIFIFDTFGKFISKPIGKSKKWNKLFLNGKFENIQYNLRTLIYGIKENTKELIIDTLYNEPIDISFISAEYYPEIQVECQYSLKDSTINNMLNSTAVGISSIIVDFIPLDELSVVRSDTELNENGKLRGEPAKLNLTIRNLSLRTDVSNVEALINVNDGGSSTYNYKVRFDSLKSNTTQTKNILIETDYLQQENPIFVNLNNNEQPKEQYYFNNSTNLILDVKKDTIKPSVQLFIDNNLHQKDEYISKLPEFRVELYDNSPLQLIDSNSITVRVNGYLHPYQRTLESKFERINDGTNLKGVFTFKPDTLQYEDVSIIIYFYDAELNRDTLLTSARTSLFNAEIIEHISYPNPAKDDINFSLKYKAPESDAEAIIDIFDMNGSKVNSIKEKIAIGNNIINFFAKDFHGNSLSSHLYFYKIQIKSKYYVEPKFGKFVIIR